MEYRELTPEICRGYFIDYRLVPIYLAQCYEDAMSLSDDPNTKVGARLYQLRKETLAAGMTLKLIGTGTNSLPKGVITTPERLVKPDKYVFLEHAERNAIFSAAREGNYTDATVLFAPWFACADCARAIIQAGVGLVIGHKTALDMTADSWKQSITNAYKMFDEAGVKFYHYNGLVGAVSLMNGVKYNV